MRLFRRCGAVGVASMLGNCTNPFNGSDCAPVGHPAMIIHIRDAKTLAPLSGAIVILTGAFTLNALVASYRALRLVPSRAL
jgi:hypothetical protein